MRIAAFDRRTRHIVTRISRAGLGLALALSFSLSHALAQPTPIAPAKPQSQMVIIDTDIGDDIDDVFALGLALASPELKILGITSAWADPALKARLIDRFLCETGRADIPVAEGIDKRVPGQGRLSQARWAARQPEKQHPAAVDFLLEQIKQHPGEITLIAIGPLTNVAAAVQRDPQAFRQLRRIVMMGGSIRRGYGELSYTLRHGPDAEYNIAADISASQAVFNSGVPIYLMPLDSTQIKLDDFKRQMLFSQSTNLTDAMAVLYEQWSLGHHIIEPTLYDAMAIAFAVDPSLCPVSSLRIEVDAKGYTREMPGKPNTLSCLNSNSDSFYDFFMPRLMQQRLYGSCERKP